ncbi:uncharacterized protein LOC109612846 isoform X2 [Musca domestica]|uniref:Uncharacterized protein LOC109612846 isoform X2 n=1 Tax=Musca domestica TaxID=7370 RepID=A0ABM3UKT3_MUSDO|nr:uncharacterized protein LOC109612846 isoform X2 [Musca domestica]
MKLEKLKILSLNLFVIMFKATTLNPYRLQRNLEENFNIKKVEIYLSKPCGSSFHLCHHVLVWLVSLFLVSKFLAGYMTLAANVIALFPILTEALPQLLIPPLLAQAFDHILLNSIEVVLGYLTLYYFAPTTNSKVSILVIFLTAMTIKIVIAIGTLNIYSDFYQHLKKPIHRGHESFESLPDHEFFIKTIKLN